MQFFFIKCEEKKSLKIIISGGRAPLISRRGGGRSPTAFGALDARITYNINKISHHLQKNNNFKIELMSLSLLTTLPKKRRELKITFSGVDGIKV